MGLAKHVGNGILNHFALQGRIMAAAIALICAIGGSGMFISDIVHHWQGKSAEAFVMKYSENGADDNVTLKFSVSAESKHEVIVRAYRVRARSADQGKTIPVVYDPENPDDVRNPITWSTVKTNLIAIGIGLIALAFVFLERVVYVIYRIYQRCRVQKSSAKPTGVFPKASPTVGGGRQGRYYSDLSSNT